MADPIQAIRMPRWGMTMTEGTVANWLVEEGAAVASDQDMVEIETTKITNVMEAGYGGIVRRIVADPGAVVPVGALIAVLADPSVPDAEIDAFIEARKAEAQSSGGPAAPASRIVDTGLGALNVLSLGEGDGIPVVLLHGFGGDLNNWLFNQEALAAGRAVHAFDLPGHGASTLEIGAGDLAALAAMVEAGISALGISAAHLVGHSLGGAVALKLAATQPDRVVSITLIAPAGLGDRVGENYIADFLAASRRRPVADVLSRLFASPDAVTRDMIEGVQRFKQIDGVPEALAKLAGAVFPEGRQADDLRSTLSAVHAPVLLIWGDKDRILAPADGGSLGPGVQYETIAGAGHMPHMEAAAQVNRLIAAHIASAEG